KKSFIFVFTLSIIIFLNACALRKKTGTEPVGTSERIEAPAEKPVETKKIPPVVKKERVAPAKGTVEVSPVGEVFQTGIASWYGGKFQGRRTANGERYDMYKLTAAHKTLPFHTIVEVENLDNSKRVRVRINDRGPFVKDRIIDLSYKAAQRIGSDSNGIAPVTLRQVMPTASTKKLPGSMKPKRGFVKETIKETAAPQPGTTVEARTPVTPPVVIPLTAATTPETAVSSAAVKPVPAKKAEVPVKKPVHKESDTDDVECFLQAGAFGEKANAEKMLKNIKIILADVSFKILREAGLFKVVSSRLPSRARAEELKQILLNIDIDAFIKTY
ncbi:MAG: septal ring lytic transglycosylase RlpA family protein, partial [bacterium]|nr:septal ring lytic transglycosylase RlpA family protein [bacterium]